MDYVLQLKYRDSDCIEKVNLTDVWKKSASNVKIIKTLKMRVYKKIYHESTNHKYIGIVSLEMQRVTTNHQ